MNCLLCSMCSDAKQHLNLLLNFPFSAMSVNSPLLGYFHGDIVSFLKFEGFS